MINSAPERLIIETLNSRGEGIANTACGALTVACSLPEEILDCEIIETKGKSWGKIQSIIQTSPNRVQAPCPHFGSCGGCSLQHLNIETYKKFKVEQISRPLQEQDLDPLCIQDPIIIGPRQRRRIDFMAKKFPEGLSMGFHQINSRRRIKLETCAIVVPEIETLLIPLRSLLEELLQLREQTHVFMLAAANGVDLLLAGFKRDLTDTEKETLRNFAINTNLTRLTYKVKRRAEILYEKEPPYVLFSGQRIHVDPNVFLQASAQADEVLAKLVIENLPPKSKLIADLFCGRGTLSLPIAQTGREVHGYEGDKHAISALRDLNHPNLRADIRDLFADPLKVDELQKYEAIVLNPPRSGAKDQLQNIAKAGVPTIIYVSCNPNTFAKDMSLLAIQGYQLREVVPVDQFMWSHHVEVVAVITKR